MSANAVRFWYRQSPRPLKRLAFSIGVNPMVTPSDPPLASGDVLIALNGAGRLLSFTAVPVRGQPVTSDPGTPDLTGLLRAAGIDASAWTPDAEWRPTFWADARRLAGAGLRRSRRAAPPRDRHVRGRPVEFMRSTLGPAGRTA